MEDNGIMLGKSSFINNDDDYESSETLRLNDINLKEESNPCNK